MCIPRNEIAQTRKYSPSHMLETFSVYFEAGQRLSSLFAATGRDTMHDGSRQLAQFGQDGVAAPAIFPAILWSNSSARAIKLLDATFETLGEAQRSMLHSMGSPDTQGRTTSR